MENFYQSQRLSQLICTEASLSRSIYTTKSEKMLTVNFVDRLKASSHGVLEINWYLLNFLAF